MNNLDPSSLEALKLVLKEINDSVTDFDLHPAQTAIDIGSSGDCPLHKIALWGDTQAASVLLAHGADIDAQGEDGDTPLHRAVMGHQPDMVRFLLSMGANASLKDRYSDTPLELANAYDDISLINAFLKK